MKAFAKTLPLVVRSKSSMATAVIFTTLVFGLFEYSVSRWLIGVNMDPAVHAGMQAGIVGLGAGIAVLVILQGALQRRQMVADELRRVGELNHYIRNSLELIVLATHTPEEQQRTELILESTYRIDQTLKKLMPPGRVAM